MDASVPAASASPAISRRLFLALGATGAAAMTGAPSTPAWQGHGRVDLDAAAAELDTRRAAFYAATPGAAAALERHARGLLHAADSGGGVTGPADRMTLATLAAEATCAAASALWSAKADPEAEDLVTRGLRLSMGAGLASAGARLACTGALVHLTSSQPVVGAGYADRLLAVSVPYRGLAEADRMLVEVYRIWTQALLTPDEKALTALEVVADRSAPETAAMLRSRARMHVVRAIDTGKDLGGRLLYQTSGEIVAALQVALATATTRRQRAAYLVDLAEASWAAAAETDALATAIKAASLLTGSDAERLRGRLWQLYYAPFRPTFDDEQDELLAVLKRKLELHRTLAGPPGSTTA